MLARGVRRAFGLADASQMDAEHWNAVTALWSLVHGYAHLAIGGKFQRLAGDDGLDAFVERSLGPMLDAAMQGLFAPARRSRRL